MNWTCFDLTMENHIAHIQLNRPKELNSFTLDLWREFPLAIEAINQNSDMRVMVISSTGKHFTAGMDLGVFASFEKSADKESARQNASFMELVKTLQQTFTPLTQSKLPVIAAVQGGCIGAGLDLITACDMRYATQEAFFTLHEINIGMMADVGTMPRLQHVVPAGIAREMAFTGSPLKAKRAEQVGLLNGVFETHDELVDGVMKVAAGIAAKSPMAIWGSKEMMNYADNHTIEDTLDRVAVWQAGMFSQDDVKAAIGAQMQKQTASFENLAGKKKLAK